MPAAHPPPAPVRARPAARSARGPWPRRRVVVLLVLFMAAFGVWLALRGRRSASGTSTSMRTGTAASSAAAGAVPREASVPERATPRTPRTGAKGEHEVPLPSEDIRPEDRAAVDALLR
jgi:hypothetical protein